MIIRHETNDDFEKVFHINKICFETDAEANLVNTLRDEGTPFISLVAEVDDEVVGHIMFTPTTVNNDKAKLMGLAPMAVLPEHQNTGIGTELVLTGLDECKRDGVEAVVVLGHPDYYPRFGFLPSMIFNIKSEYDVPDDVFMALELKENALQNVSGVVKYLPAFASV